MLPKTLVPGRTVLVVFSHIRQVPFASAGLVVDAIEFLKKRLSERHSLQNKHTLKTGCGFPSLQALLFTLSAKI
jgi:hypothetical protein